MTMLQEPQDAGTPRPPPSPWSFARPDGPLAEALRRAQAQLARSGPQLPQDVAPPPPDPLPIEPHGASPAPRRELAAADFEALAREAKARDDVREAMALALEWPEEAPAPRERLAVARWMGWIALAGAVGVALAAAWVAMRPEPRAPAAAPAPAADGLRMERQLALPKP